MEFKDYYAVLGVSAESPVDQIKRAYRKLARKYHPDVSKETGAEARFKEINEAWEVLGDPKKKQRYDSLRKRGRPGEDFDPNFAPQYADNFSFDSNLEGDFSEFFNAIFGNRGPRSGGFRSAPPVRKGQDLHTKITLTLLEAYQGKTCTIQLIPSNAQSRLPEGGARNLQVKIPSGVTQGSQMRLRGQGGAGQGNGPNGDVYIEVAILPHPFFTLHHKDIELKLPVAPWEAALGAELAVPTLGGKVNIKIPPQSQTGKKLRLKGRGLPGTPPGDQYVVIEIMLPPIETEEAKTLFQKMAKTIPFTLREKLHF